MSVTRDTSHLEILLLNCVAPMKRSLISATLDTSHSLIGPRASREQSPLCDSLRHASMALLSFAFDGGENADRSVQEFGEINMRRAKKMTCVVKQSTHVSVLHQLGACMPIYARLCQL